MTQTTVSSDERGLIKFAVLNNFDEQIVAVLCDGLPLTQQMLVATRQMRSVVACRTTTVVQLPRLLVHVTRAAVLLVYGRRAAAAYDAVVRALVRIVVQEALTMRVAVVRGQCGHSAVGGVCCAARVRGRTVRAVGVV